MYYACYPSMSLQKKMEKAEKRLGQITAQMDERIIKESFFANEKAVMSYVKSVVRGRHNLYTHGVIHLCLNLTK